MRRCPQCGSSDLFQSVGGYLGSEWRCKRCGYQGAFVVESEEEMPHPETDRDPNSAKLSGVPFWFRILALLILILFIWMLLPRW
ncbi:MULTISPECIES: hypothetical protein [Methanocalculus]|uniref:hypothetical protein n=1 Tax=Methanocalculus TaxID=71151 RepID=UPI0020A07581|nr:MULTISPECIES: hypothetical protein [unclassified Methanocalculus]MCP1661569.1 transposase-like protein [Methanocalculus sp. AMF5]